MTTAPVSIVMIEDDEGHARLIEKNIRRAGISNEIIPFARGAEALDIPATIDASWFCSISICRI